MHFPPTVLTPDERSLRASVREFLHDERSRIGSGSTNFGGGSDREFSRRLADRGWVGMSIPTEFGGHGRTAVDRFVVVTELLAAGAPVSAHWIADRQTAPSILKFGTDAQKRCFLPRIAKAECTFCIGMSEPDSGSDLASIRTAATRTDGGWLLTGTKVWTSGAHEADFVLVLCRTSPLGENRHEGMSQLIVDLTSPGVAVNPIISMNGAHHFNEVVFDQVFVPDDLLLGEEGQGWRQVNSELAYERSGPDRWLSTYGLFRAFLGSNADTTSDAVTNAVGRIAARYRTLHNLSLSVARMIDEGGAPAAEAALVKDLGTVFEKQVAETVRDLAGISPDIDAPETEAGILADAIFSLPALTIRGGTTEILRGAAAKELIR
ncbi:acyl-CoA dehydrogenase family protein [Rhodococcus jostii]|uniref:Acyl-CoA dehydrogenase n=1 Tax=Rhodococcus jostii TaxID=132919 RepID=A0A1H5H7G0_RHOJO|nr:acyl-CoA dehydrogenase family protein [Rhodococcus jostii]SEE23805.1 Acyl-CoA dehydrogenase [Rhodococcus jostii]